jgi:hypothetical protein
MVTRPMAKKVIKRFNKISVTLNICTNLVLYPWDMASRRSNLVQYINYEQ